MKKNLLRISMNILLLGIVSLVVLNSCKKDDEDEQPSAKDPIASFQFAISETNFLEVTFTNFSKNAVSYTWDFGDGETSTEKNPVHVYAEAGKYSVKLTAKNEAGKSANYSQDITITDPNEAYKLLTGEESKTWKLFREGVSMSLGPNPEDPAAWWPGLENDGARPCLYYQEFTFYFDGTYEFNDNGEFWGEYGVFDGQWNYEICFEALPENMINKDGVDVSAWLSGTHSFTYDPSVGAATINGFGAWIGIPKLTTGGETTVPVESTTFNVEITQETGYDLMTVSFNYGEGGYWKIVYVNYSDPSLEPDVVLEEDPYGEDLPDLTPDEMYNTFETPSSYVVLDTAHANGAASAANNMELTIGVADPAGGGTNVAEYVRIGTYQELQFFMEYDIQFDNFTTLSLDVYMPSSNDYSGSLTKDIAIVIGEHSETEEWWTGHIQYDAEASALDEWVTVTFNLDAPTSGPGMGSYTPFTNDKLDFFAISLGGGGHNDQGTFYIRNFMFE
ncbi:MAG: PKD domain-containing protein [Bacteroidota bacterium]|nr:PKD domain-containing protein [Bacteroidota bacterium]